MIIFVKAKPGSHQEKIEKSDDTHFTVWVREPPVKGLANLIIRKVLADYLKIPNSNIYLKSGYSSKMKVFEVLTKCV